MLQKLAINLITIYQRYIGMGVPSCCRFSPSCSEYARQAIVKYGLCQGIFKAMYRLLRCQPFSKSGGFDPLR